jgi:hypothetical protein
LSGALKDTLPWSRGLALEAELVLWGVTIFLDGLFHGKAYENWWFGGYPILANPQLGRLEKQAWEIMEKSSWTW